MSIFIADTSALKNRSLMFAYANSPYMITTWISGPISEAFLKGPGFRWGFGAFAIITPFVTMPLYFLFQHNYNKAKKAGLVPDRTTNRTIGESFKHYLVEFDAVGLFLITGGLALFLLPFNIYSFQTDGWKSATVLSMLIVGFLMIVAFVVWEKYWAPVTFLPYELLTDRTVLGACVLAAVLFISFYIWNAYFQSFLQVVNRLTVTEATYVGNIYSMGSCFWAIVVGILIRYTGRFKWIALYFGVPLNILGVGLMAAFRQPGVNIGYIVMCQIFVAFAGGALVICEQMAAMAAVSHQYVAVVLAIEAMFASIGGAIGLTVAGAIWTGVFPYRLAEYLPADLKDQAMTIYGDMTVQKSYPDGSAARDAITAAYGDAQKMMLIGGTCILGLGIVCVAVWRDIKVKDFKQVKGNVV
jgi:MFS family permease